ncbi:PAS domain S-box protein [Methanoculleus sp.]|uniref:PAS domain-containing protein n=1 Tax=Methanoculleus sp. TaxID=90427 RepID=UPI002602F683|nr:PAS domain S-box protein [Methanoculleus sp.]MDI6867317.1 PAS domain S-box protein [Methanoculleus sp.]
MSEHSDPRLAREALREKIIGLGETSLHKSYYPELQSRLAELERFRALLDQTYDAIFLIQAKGGRVVDFNATAQRYLGYSREELLSRSFEDLVCPEQRSDFLDYARRRHRSPAESGETYRVSLLTRDGRDIPMEVAFRSVTFGDDRYIVAIARDITERIRIERDLRIKESAFESSINGILIADLERAVTYANPSFAEMFGYSGPEALRGMNLESFFVDPSVAEEIVRDLLQNRPVILEVEGLRRDESSFHIEVSGSAVQNETGQPFCIMLIVMDITERIRLDNLKRESYAQLGKNIEQFAVIGDHIRNPLQVIVGCAEMIDDPLAEKILEQAGLIDRFIAELDRGWVESANVRNFLRKHGEDVELPERRPIGLSRLMDEDT